MKKKCDALKSKLKLEEFEKKIEKLKLETDQIKEIIIEWECGWLERRKSEPVRSFLSNNYVKRPPRRLIARDAGEHSTV